MYLIFFKELVGGVVIFKWSLPVHMCYLTALLQITTFENATTIRINNKYGKLQQCNKGLNSKECHTLLPVVPFIK
jgi:hypothetical protein